MSRELANSAKNVHQTPLAESVSAFGLLHQAITELSPQPLVGNIYARNSERTGINLVSDSSNLSQNIESSPSSEKLPLAIRDTLRKRFATFSTVASPETEQLGRLTPELMTAVDQSSKIIVREPSTDTTGSDLVINRDGTIVQYLDLDLYKVNGGNLFVSLEKGAAGESSLSAEQKETLRKLISYATDRNKIVAIESPSSEAGKTTGTSENAASDSRFDSSKNGARAASSMSHGRSLPDFEQLTGRNDSSSASQSRSSDGYASSTGDNTSYSPSVSRDYTQMSLFDLLMTWFDEDSEAFKKLMPDLYKKAAGINGKLNPKLLRQLLESKDPIVGKLKNQLPDLAEAFPKSKNSNSGPVSASSDAVNQTGAKLADKAAQVSDELASSGYCAKGVSYAIERATGKVIWGNANDMRNSLPDQGFTVAQSKDLKVGQVVHVYWTPEVYAQEQARRGPCPNYGDIAVIGKGRDGQLYAYNDAAIPLNDYLQKSRYDWNTLKVFNPPNV